MKQCLAFMSDLRAIITHNINKRSFIDEKSFKRKVVLMASGDNLRRNYNVTSRLMNDYRHDDTRLSVSSTLQHRLAPRVGIIHEGKR